MVKAVDSCRGFDIYTVVYYGQGENDQAEVTRRFPTKQLNLGEGCCYHSVIAEKIKEAKTDRER